MKTLLTIFAALTLLTACKKSEDPEPVVTETKKDSIEVRITGNWQKFQCNVVYDHDNFTFPADSSRDINFTEFSTIPPYTKPIYVDQGYHLPVKFVTTGNIHVYIQEGCKYNMEAGEWVYMELYQNGVLQMHSDTLTKDNLGLANKDFVKK